MKKLKDLGLLLIFNASFILGLYLTIKGATENNYFLAGVGGFILGGWLGYIWYKIR